MAYGRDSSATKAQDPGYSAARLVALPHWWRGPFLLAAAALVVLVFLGIANHGRSGEGQVAMEAIYTALIAFSAAACLGRANASTRERLPWLLIGLGLAAWTAGDICFWLSFDPAVSSYDPSAILYLAYYALALGGIAALFQRRELYLRASLDALLGMVGMAMLWCWVVFAPVMGEITDNFDLTTLIYPFLDFAIFVFVFSLLAYGGFRPGLGSIVIGAGFLLSALADSIYFIQDMQGTYRPGTVLDTLWPAATLLLAAGAWLPIRQSQPATRIGNRWPAALSGGFAALAITAVALNQVDHLDGITSALAIATLVAAAAVAGASQRARQTAEREARASAMRTVHGLAVAVDAKDHYTRNHSERVALFATAIALQLQWSIERIERLAVAARLHDVGKIAVPDSILLKPECLTDAEFEQVRRHSEEGEKILAAIGMPEEARWIRHHHERWSGGGYPDGIAGEQIPLESRILAAADSLDAMTADRSYRPALSVEQAIDELRTNASKQFDPEVARTLVELLESGRIDIRPRWQVVTAFLTEDPSHPLPESERAALQRALDVKGSDPETAGAVFSISAAAD